MSVGKKNWGALLSYLELITKTSRTLALLENLLILRIPSQKFWSWEVYGIGIAVKKLLGIPSRKVIACGSDHGVMLEFEPSKEEISMGSDIFITWSAWRLNLDFPDRRKVVPMQHPWVAYRRKLNLTCQPGKRGTLVFVPHSVPGLPTETFSLEQYIQELAKLPSEFHPLTLCFHVHDVNRTNIEIARRLNIDVQTVGASLSPKYVQRFYKLISRYQFATSPAVGSQLFYCEEFGLNYFLFNPGGKFQRQLVGYRGPEIDADFLTTIENLFTLEGVERHKKLKTDLVRDALGLDFPEPQSEEVSRILHSHIGLD